MLVPCDNKFKSISVDHEKNFFVATEIRSQIDLIIIIPRNYVHSLLASSLLLNQRNPLSAMLLFRFQVKSVLPVLLQLLECFCKLWEYPDFVQNFEVVLKCFGYLIASNCRVVVVLVGGRIQKENMVHLTRKN